MTVLDTIFGSKTRARILEVLLLDERQPGLLELQRAVGTSVSSVQKELERLEAVGLVRSDRVGGFRKLSAEAGHPLAGPLRELLAAARELEGSVAVELPAARVNPAVRSQLPAIISACERHGVRRAALVGSATQPDARVAPHDLDILVRFDPDLDGYSARYFGLLEELERIMGMPVDIIEEGSLTNPLLRDEFESTQVVIYEAA